MTMDYRWPRIASASLLALATALGAQAAAAQSENETEATRGERTSQAITPMIAADDWDYDRIYGAGWSLERLLDEAEVYGGNGEEIGNLENVLISDDGKIQAVIAEVGGFIDLGDTHVAVPWDRIYISPDLETVETPILEEEAGDYSPFKELYRKQDADDVATVSSDLQTGQNVWKATRLLDEYIYLPNGDAYGYVDDLIFIGPKLHAVVVSSDASYGGGFLALPYRAEGHDAEGRTYDAGYERDEIEQLERFDYDRMADQVDVGTVRPDESAKTQDKRDERQDKAAKPQDEADRKKKRERQAKQDEPARESAKAEKPGKAGRVAKLKVASSDTFGPYLTDQAGRSLYLFKADTKGKEGADAESACYDECAEAWPPLQSSKKPQAADRVKPKLLGTIEREDGVQQVTYNGWPLYYYEKDKEPGSTAGQDIDDFGAEWYLVTPAGKTAHAKGETEED